MARILYNAERLAFAVVNQAVLEAAGNGSGKTVYEAQQWLLSDDALSLLEPLGVDVIITEWVRRGCPRPEGRMLRCDKRNDRNWHEYYLKKREREK